MASAKLALRKAVLSYSTVTASTSLVSSINTRALTYSTLSGSTINAATLFVNGSQITTNGGLSSQWTTSGSNIYYNTGSVGIGTTAPTIPLHIYGSGQRILLDGSSAAQTYIMFATQGTNRGYIGTGAAGADMNITAYAGQNLLLQAGGTEHMRITSSGKVGIGSTSPQYKLDVAGDVNVTGGFYVNGSAFSGGSSQWTTSGSKIYYSTGNVGIGSTSPQYAMDVVGTVNVTGGLYVNGAPYTLGGGIIVPNTTGLNSNTWSTSNGISWTSSCSPSAASAAYSAFNNTHAYGQNWLGQLSPSGQYNSSGNYIGSASTTVLGGIGAISGEWVQIQSSFALTLYSYIFAVGSWQAQQKNMYVVGSNDGTNWYPLQRIVLDANPFSTDFSKATTSVLMNYSGTQIIKADTTQNATTTTYSYTTQTFTYFRFITVSNFLTWQDCGQVGELYLAFTTPSSSGTSSQWTTTGSNISYITGSVGIGISSPSYRLHVGVMDNTYNLAAYLGSGGIGNYGNNSLLNSTSLFIAGWGMTAAAWGVTSDRRIKTNIESVSSMLKIIDQINVVKYDYIDPRFGREECSVIAQELKEVFPNAINMTTDFITNIMKRCTHVRDYDTVTLHVSLDNTLYIQSGCRIKIIQLDTPENEIITTIQSIDVANNRMVVSTWNNYSPASNIFVYGTEVDDFLSVDKPQLGVMALQGVKELHQIIRQQEERIVRLEALLSSRAV